MQGIIINNISNQYIVETKKALIKCNARGKLKQEEIIPVVGDKVEIEIIDEQKNEGAINKIYPRTNYSKRPKIANLTQLLFVLSAKDPKPDLLMLDKQLALADFYKIKATIILNKIDLAEVEQIKEIYEKIGYTVILTNAKNLEGINQVKQALQGNISAFAGNSGVGKSTLLNAIFEKEITKQGEISSKNKKGKNTTTNVALYKINENTYVADTPGFSTFEISEIPKEELYKHFIEFKQYEKDCKFVGCTHIKEEDCGIKNALETGKINECRYNNYVQIYKQIKEMEERKW